MRFGAISAYLQSLADGEPVAIGFTLFFVVLALALGVFAWITKRRLAAEDARLKKRRGY
jgi:hypothetical protein